MCTERTPLRTVLCPPLFVFFLLFGASAELISSTPGVVTALEFSGNGRIPLRKDPTPTAPLAEIQPRWKPGEPALSVAYTSGSVPVLGVTIVVTAPVPATTVMVRGIGPDGITFAPSNVTPRVAGDSTILVYASRPASRPFDKDVVCSYQPFEVRWEISTDGGAHWQSHARSTCTLYVTFAQPVAEKPEQGYAFFESLLSISCNAAQSMANELDVIAKIWEEFADRAVLTCGGDTLAFYRVKKGDFEITTGGLLLTKTGICYAWAHLMIDLLRIQGITRKGWYVALGSPPQAQCGEVVGMLMPNCRFLQPSGADVCPDFPYVAAYDPNNVLELIGPDVISVPGMPGQGEANPTTIFHDHALVHLNGVYYDPSYGRSYASLDDFQNVLAGWVILGSANERVKNVDFNGDGKVEDVDVTVARISNDPRRLALQVLQADY